MKKLLVYGPIAMALIAALAIGIPAAVTADTSDEAVTETTTTTADEQKPGQEIFLRVAEILNIDEETVSAAFQQATREMMTERQQERLQNAIENGLITEDEATEIQAWWDSRPESMEGMGPLGGEGPMGGGNQFMGRGRMMEQADDCACCAP
jgi:hypothetical protein